MPASVRNNVKINIEQPHDFPYLAKRYVQEAIEAFIAIYFVMFVMKKQFEWPDLIRMALIIGFVTLILEEYNKDYSSNLKQGILFTIGANFVAA